MQMAVPWGGKVALVERDNPPKLGGGGGGPLFYPGGAKVVFAEYDHSHSRGGKRLPYCHLP